MLAGRMEGAMLGFLALCDQPVPSTGTSPDPIFADENAVIIEAARGRKAVAGFPRLPIASYIAHYSGWLDRNI